MSRSGHSHQDPKAKPPPPPPKKKKKKESKSANVKCCARITWNVSIFVLYAQSTSIYNLYLGETPERGKKISQCKVPVQGSKSANVKCLCAFPPPPPPPPNPECKLMFYAQSTRSYIRARPQKEDRKSANVKCPYTDQHHMLTITPQPSSAPTIMTCTILGNRTMSRKNVLDLL